MDRSRTSRLLVCACLLILPILADDAPQDSKKTGAQEKDLASLDLETLLNIKVTTASKFSEKLSDAPGVISVVTKDELQRFGAITLAEILRRVPGLSPTSAYFTDRSMVAARGDQTRINGGHILFLINGRPTREVLEGGLISDLLESFPVEILERIEVIRGPGSVLYGSDAFSAVVNLITQKADHDELVVTGLSGAGETAATSGKFLLKRGDLSLTGAGEFHQNPDWFTTYRSAAFGAENIAIPDRGKGAYLDLNYKGLSVMSSYTQWQSTVFARGFVGGNRWRRSFTDVGYALKPSAKWDMSFNLTFTRNTLDAANFVAAAITRDSNEVIFEWTNALRLTDRDQLIFGASYNHAQGEELFYGAAGAGSVIPIADGGLSGATDYAQLDHALPDNLKLIGGFQANKNGTLAVDVVPRVGLIWNPASHFNAKILYSGAYRAPSIDELMLNHPVLKGNPNLKPEKVATLDVSATYQGNRVLAGVTYFHSHQTDSIIPDTSTFLWMYQNFGEATFHGMEVEGKYYFKKAFFVMGSASYQANEDGNGLNNVTPVPNISAQAGLSYSTENAWTASVFDVFEGPLDKRYAGVLNPSPASYHLLDAHLRVDLSKYLHFDRKSGVALLAHGDNLLNRRVWMPAWGDSTGDTMPVFRGRTVYVGLELFLKKE